jgi:hypothetical protein
MMIPINKSDQDENLRIVFLAINAFLSIVRLTKLCQQREMNKSIRIKSMETEKVENRKSQILARNYL